jgi:serine/threonine-protein kinase
MTNQPPADAKERFLNPDALVSPREINPRISPAVERVILTAIAMHPDQRPPSVTAFREMLSGNLLPSSLSPLVPAQGEWRRAVVENWGLVTVTAIVLALAAFVTFV